MRNCRVLSLLALLGVLSALVAVPAGADPSSGEIRGELSTAQERLDALQMEAAAVVEDYNEATVALEEASAQLSATQEEIDELSSEIEQLTEAAGDHARRLHKLGPTIELSSVLMAGDSGEMGARTAALRRILDGQRADFEGLDAARTSMAAAEERLAEQHEEAAAREAEVAAQRAQVETRLADLDTQIAQLEDELTDAEEREEAEARAAAEAEARAAAEAEAQAAADTADDDEQDAPSGGDPAGPSTNGGGSSGGGSSGGGSSDAAPAPAPSTRQSAQVAVDTALAQVGKPYQYGANGPGSFDCSGLTSYAWRAAGVDITRTSRSQWHATSRVSRSQLQPGDLVFYSRSGQPGGISHVAMYIGGGDIVEASRSGIPVRTSSSGLSRSDIIGYGRP